MQTFASQWHILLQKPLTSCNIQHQNLFYIVESYRTLLARALWSIVVAHIKNIYASNGGNATYLFFKFKSTCFSISLKLYSNFEQIVKVHSLFQPYLMRNCVLTMMSEIVLRELSAEGLDEKQRGTRDQFLDMLEDHIHDVNAFTRSKCLQCWLKIVNEKVRSSLQSLMRPKQNM